MPEEINDLLELLIAIDASSAEMTELRRRRAAIVGQLRASGWSLQRIADAVGRTKQTVDQWVRP